ncbi:Sodium transporter HKT1-like protein [Drosera capensis]
MASHFVAGKKPGDPCSSLMKYLLAPVVDFVVYQVSPFWINLFYFVLLSMLGFLSLKITKPRDGSLDDLDLFFTSVSASTVSSMSIVEMEAFSNVQLIILTVLMLMGGEVFTSMLELRFRSTELPKKETPYTNGSIELVELGKVDRHPSTTYSKHDGIRRFLSYVVLGYLLVVQTVGLSLVFFYTTIVPSASQVLKSKGIQLSTFSIFTTVSTFTNCGFVPTNENMMVFKEYSGLLLILIPQLLMGNTLYPIFLRTVIWALKKLTNRTEFSFILDNYDLFGYGHLMSWLRSYLLGATVLVLIMLQLVMFCLMEWRTEGFEGLSLYQRFVGSLFQVTNSRHAGESIVDLSTLSSAVLVLFVVMMYLPPYTSFVPGKSGRTLMDDASGDAASGENQNKKKMRSNCSALRDMLGFPSLSHIAMFVIMICITERQKLKQDPLNFNVFNIVLEVVSAYGNVGFSMGYSCGRRRAIAGADQYAKCVDKWYGFAGWWSKEGKLILVLVMFLGRLKRFSLHGGRAWILA